MLTAALQYLERGWSVFPLRGKRPLIAEWRPYQRRLPTREQVEEWWSADPEAGVGMALGKVSGAVRVDADGSAALVELVRLGGLPETAEFTTPRGGRGWLLSYMDGVVTEQLWKGAGDHEELRVQSDGAYTVLPPSPHPDGGHYEWVREGPVATLPRWLRDRNVERVLKDLERELRPTLRLPERGEILEALEHLDTYDDYDSWVQVGMALRSAGDDYLEVWTAWSKQSTKFREGECERKWRTFRTDGRGLTARSLLHWAEAATGWRPISRHEPIDDTGNARVLARMGDGAVKHTDRWGWLHWDGARWTTEGAEKRVQEMQKEVLQHRLDMAVRSLARLIRESAQEEGFDRRRKAKMGAIKSIRKHRDERHYRGARTLAESEPLLTADYRAFDTHPFLFNSADATVDLRTGESKDHDPTDMLTQLCPYKLDTGARCPVWDSFLAGVLPDESVREFLRRFLGACMTADVSLQMMPVFWGTGANGKSTLVETVMAVLGPDYAMKARRDLLMVSRNTQHPTSVARLRGKRFVACVESTEGGRLDEALVKELTGGDTIAARFMHQDEFEFRPSHKVVLVTNHKPEVHGTDDAIWRRLPLVEFGQSFPDGDPRRDPDLRAKLLAEAEGILAWMLGGCADWLASGKCLELPPAVRAATREYRSEQDRVGAYMAECTARDPDSRVRTDELMKSYLSWCAANNHRPMDGRAFGRVLTERGVQLDQTRKYRVGVKLL